MVLPGMAIAKIAEIGPDRRGLRKTAKRINPSQNSPMRRRQSQEREGEVQLIVLRGSHNDARAVREVPKGFQTSSSISRPQCKSAEEVNGRAVSSARGHYHTMLRAMPSLADRNIPLFIAFRVAFNARWYYPILAVLFLDFGLTLEQYALLNVAWAAAIVLLEVPSGALADVIGRRRMVVIAGAFMVGEFLILCCTPFGFRWLFPLFLLNRILSGAAEACASGADESLAYDSLRAEGREAEWPAVLGRLSTLR